MNVGILTGGGDCAGLNAALRGAAHCLMQNGASNIIGIEDGFLGLLERRTRKVTADDLDNLLQTGGTFLGACNNVSPLSFNGENKAQEVRAYYDELGLDAIIAFGGDGTMSLCHALSKYGMQFVGVPKTIDNDLAHTDQTFGFDSAVSVAVEAIDRLHTTAKSHHRTMIVETMGRYAGWIALYAGLAGGADVILMPEFEYDVNIVAATVNARIAKKRHTIIVVAEGAKSTDGILAIAKQVQGSPDTIRLGGAGLNLQEALEPLVSSEVRTTILGHTQRGGVPTATDRILATNYGCNAAELVLQHQLGYMVCLQGGEYTHTPFSAIANKVRLVPEDNTVLQSAKACGITFG